MSYGGLRLPMFAWPPGCRFECPISLSSFDYEQCAD